MRRAITLYGMPALRGRFADSKRLLPRHVAQGIEAALAFIEIKAKHILDVDIYQKPRMPFETAPSKGDTEAMYQKFTREFTVLVNAVVLGELKNISPHALFIELGTDEEGSGHHQINAEHAATLRWIDPATGKVMFAPYVVVSGIKPTHFLERAMQENLPEVREILRQHIRRALDPLIGEEF